MIKRKYDAKTKKNIQRKGAHQTYLANIYAHIHIRMKMRLSNGRDNSIHIHAALWHCFCSEQQYIACARDHKGQVSAAAALPPPPPPRASKKNKPTTKSKTQTLTYHSDVIVYFVVRMRGFIFCIVVHIYFHIYIYVITFAIMDLKKIIIMMLKKKKRLIACVMSVIFSNITQTHRDGSTEHR